MDSVKETHLGTQQRDSLFHEKILQSQANKESFSEDREQDDGFLDIESLPEIIVEETVSIALSQTFPTSIARSVPNIESKDCVESSLNISVGADNAKPQANLDSNIDLEELSHEEGSSILMEEEYIDKFEGVRWVLSDKAMMSEDEMRRYRRSVNKTDDKD